VKNNDATVQAQANGYVDVHETGVKAMKKDPSLKTPPLSPLSISHHVMYMQCVN